MNRIINFVDYCGMNYLSATTHPHYRSFFAYPPEGYEFSREQKYNKNAENIVMEFVQELFDIGLNQEEVQQFLNTRKPGLAYIPENAQLCFMPTICEFITDRPWFTNIEDWTTLFTPGLNRPTYNLDVQSQSWFKAMKHMFSKPNCKAITTHMKSTIKSLEVLFDHDKNLCSKLRYLPMAYPDVEESKRPRKLNRVKNDTNLIFLFTNSYGGCHRNLELRGGIESIYAFKNVYEQGYTNIILYLTGSFNLSGYPDLDEFVKNCPNIQIYPNFMTDQQLYHLLNHCDCFLCPAMRIHNCSLMSTMTFGLPTIFSDGWGFHEYIKDGENGFIAKGQWGVTTYIDGRGIFRDNYEACRINQTLINNIEEKMLTIIKNRSILDVISKNAKEYATEHFNVFKRRELFKNLLDEIWEE